MCSAMQQKCPGLPWQGMNNLVKTTSLLIKKNGDKVDNLNESTVYAYDSDEAADFYNEGRLWYLVHNSRPDVLQFMLTFMKKGHCLEAFFRSHFCKVCFYQKTCQYILYRSVSFMSRDALTCSLHVWQKEPFKN